MMTDEKDALGNAVWDYYHGVENAAIAVFSQVDANYFLECSDLFRSPKEMSDIDLKALSACKGSVLDVGSGAGSHALYLQSNDVKVTALDVSPKACDIMQKRGVQNVICADFFDYDFNQTWDTLLLMMNGIGFVGSINGLQDFLAQSYEILNENGQIVFDSTFLSDDHKQWCIENDNDYGKVDYQMIYNEFITDTFSWLYIDYKNLADIAKKAGFESSLFYENKKNEYVAVLRKF